MNCLQWAIKALTLAAISIAVNCVADDRAGHLTLPHIGKAPAFTLTTQSGTALSLADLRGSPVVVTFIFTTCRSTCPILMSKLVAIQRRVSGTAKPTVFFVAITVDPETDTPETLEAYARTHGADLRSWAFLTGTPASINDVARRYAVFQKKRSPAHIFDFTDRCERPASRAVSRSGI
jgi:protein SCO1